MQEVSVDVSGRLERVQLYASLPGCAECFVALGSPWHLSKPLFQTEISEDAKGWFSIDTYLAGLHFQAGDTITIGLKGAEPGHEEMCVGGSASPGQYGDGELWTPCEGERPQDDIAFRTYMIPHEAKPIAFDLELRAGWNFISLPIEPDDRSVSAVFRGDDNIEVIYGFDPGIGYVRVNESDALEVGRGYWVLAANRRTYSFVGKPITMYQRTIDSAGWFLAGGLSVQGSLGVSNGTIEVVYEYDPMSGYVRADSDSIEPGKAYWVCVSEATKIGAVMGTIPYPPVK
jgi:hypothetical protein